VKCELASSNVTTVKEYSKEFAEIIAANSCTPDQVFNTDESG